jgi:phosphoenolpyruvate-protein kinase (PTS system EI component)
MDLGGDKEFTLLETTGEENSLRDVHRDGKM